MDGRVLFQAVAAVLVGLFLRFGMDTRSRPTARDFVAPFWQRLMKLCAFSLLAGFLGLVLSLRGVGAVDFVGLALMACGTAFVVAAKRALGDAHTFTGQYLETPRLVTHGVYSVSRNPLYFGVFQCELGATLCTVHQLPALMPRSYPLWYGVFGIALAYAVSFNCLMARYEERQLERSLRDDYRQYRRRVAFLVPWAVGPRQAGQ